MNPLRIDLGYNDEPCSIAEYLAAFPEIAERCRLYGWWLSQMEPDRAV